MKVRSRKAFVLATIWLIPIIPTYRWLETAGFYEGMIPFLLMIINIALFVFIGFESETNNTR